MRTKTLCALILGVAVPLLASCIEPNPSLPPAPTTTYSSFGERPLYRLDTGDVLDLRFPLNPELDEQIVVAPDGRISVQYAQDVLAAGRTVPDVEGEIRADYAKQLTNPMLTLSLRSASGTKYYVAGEVKTPGVYTSTAPISVLQAIAQAGGFADSGSQGKIVLIRRGADGKPAAYTVDVSGIVFGYGPGDKDVELSSYDVVYVPRTAGENISLAFEQIHKVLPWSVGFSYLLGP